MGQETVRTLLESARRFEGEKIESLVEGPDADVFVFYCGETLYNTQYDLVPSYYVTMLRKLTVREDGEPRRYWSWCRQWYRRDDGMNGLGSHTETWSDDGTLSIDGWIAELSRLKPVEYLADRTYWAAELCVRLESEMLRNPNAGINAVSPDGRWRFTEGRLHCDSTEATLPHVSWFECWTYAEFLGNGLLALALNTGQPYDENGSYGCRWGFVMVLELGAYQRWDVVAFESNLDVRAADEDFRPDAVAWHPGGVLAWLREGELNWDVRRRPREPIDHAIDVSDIDSERGLVDYCAMLSAPNWHGLSFDRTGRILIAHHPKGVQLIDVDRRMQSPDGHTWESATKEFCHTYG